jgi:hypothetical protein
MVNFEISLTDVRVEFWDEWYQKNAQTNREGYGNPCLETKQRHATARVSIPLPRGGLPCDAFAFNVAGLQTIQRWSITSDLVRIVLTAPGSTSIYTFRLSDIDRGSLRIVPTEQADGARQLSLLSRTRSGSLQSTDTKGNRVDVPVDQLELACKTDQDARMARDTLLSRR